MTLIEMAKSNQLTSAFIEAMKVKDFKLLAESEPHPTLSHYSDPKP
jgi:hypothetical protein